MQSSTPSASPPAATSQTSTPSSQLGECYYRLGIVGSKESGKTCLIMSLTMLRDPNPLGFTASWDESPREENADLKKGHKWISEAKDAIKDDRWPPPTPDDDEHKAIRFRFGDGQTRQKYVEVFDYSGELLNPELNETDRASKLRDLLGQMDGLLVIAEHPLSAQNISKVEENLNGLMQAFALLSKKEIKQKPIALIVNKWDRSEYFDQQAGSISQTRLLEDKYLKSTPPPYHTAVANALRPAAPDHFKIFAVSAMGPVEKDGDKELPPKGKLHSMGSEDPFLWLIGQVDEIALAELALRLGTKRNWATPWPPERREIKRLKSRIGKVTPERPKLNRLSRKSWLQFACGLFVWLGIMPAFYDGWKHHRAETAISDPQGEWQIGTQWLREYASSSPINHFLYKRLFSVSEAAERARQVLQKRDDSAFQSIPKLPSSNPGFLDEAERLAKEQLAMFPNSSHSDERKGVLEHVGRIRHELAFEKELSQWQQESDIILTDRIKSDQEKLDEIRSLEKIVSMALSVPLDGPLRDQWSGLGQKIKNTRNLLQAKIITGAGLDKIRQALDAADYLKAADLLADWKQPQEAAYKDLLNKFQSNVGAKVAEKTSNTSQQGAKWSDGVTEAEQFLQPSRRALLTHANVEAIQKTVRRIKVMGDEYFYKNARNTRDTPTLNAYLTEAPIQSMADEVSQYRNWLDDREKPRRITFKLTKIIWKGIPEKGWTEDTKIKLYVNDIGDPRNPREGNDSRTGVSSNLNGIRFVTLEGIKQVNEVRVGFQVWNNWFGDQKLINKTVILSPEKFLDQPTHLENNGSKFTIKVEGVLPKPDLPPWREKS